MNFDFLNTGLTWLAVGVVGQILFFMRFFVQWLASERARESVVPAAFWYFSLAGGMTLLAYAIYRRDPVFIAGQGAGLFIYIRNLYFILSKNSASASDRAVGKAGVA